MISAKGELRHTPGHVIDVVPTLLALAGDTKPVMPENAPFPGRSLVPAFAKGKTISRVFLFWHHFGNRALRECDWKIRQRRRQRQCLGALRPDHGSRRVEQPCGEGTGASEGDDATLGEAGEGIRHAGGAKACRQGKEEKEQGELEKPGASYSLSGTFCSTLPVRGSGSR